MSGQGDQADGGIDVKQILSLVNQSDHQGLEELFQQLQLEQADSQHPQAVMLLVARWMCLVLIQYQEEAKRHQEALAASQQHESELRQLLNTFLDLVNEPNLNTTQSLDKGGTTASDSAEPRTAPTAKLPRIWQFLQFVFSYSSGAAGNETAKDDGIPRLQARRPDDEHTQQIQPSVVIYGLGGFRVYVKNQLLAQWASYKSLMIFKYLAFHRGTIVNKDVLMELLWPQADAQAARRNLHQAIYSLRRTLRACGAHADLVQFKGDGYTLNPDVSIWVDFEEFEQRASTGRRLEKAGFLAQALVEYSVAEGLYQGDLFEEDRYEDWITPKRDHFRYVYQSLADDLSEHYFRQAEYTASMALCRKIIERDNCNEAAYRRLMKCYLAQGQRHLAIRQYFTCLESLKQELGLTPSPETVSLYNNMIAEFA